MTSRTKADLLAERYSSTPIAPNAPRSPRAPRGQRAPRTPWRHVQLLRPIGEFDAHTTPRLRHVLELAVSSGGRHLVLDLSRVRFADSAFAQLMFDLAAELEYDGGSLRIINAYGTAATVLRVLGIPHTTLTALVIGDS